jgi:hypothetical protein
MSIVDASGWAAWYVEAAPGPGRSPRMLALPLVVWRELEHVGVYGMVTREVGDDEVAELVHAADVVVNGLGTTRYVFSHYALRADDV